jgi:hypothetical protein
MKIAVFYPRSLYSAWSVSEGIVDTLKRMGHEPLNCGVDPQQKEISRSQFPSFDALKECDLVLVSGPEHLREYIAALYPDFKKLKTKKVCWWHETVEREDYGKMPSGEINAPYDVAFTPAAQDEKYGMKWLPFGVDTEMFNIRPVSTRPNGAVFVGLLYGPRAEFVKKHGLESLIKFGTCKVEDLSGVNVRQSVELYATELRRTKVLVNLPSLCRHAVTKIFEGAACGCAVATHVLEDERNHVLESATYYRTGEELKEVLGKQLRGCAGEALHSHRLDQRLEVILKN